LKSSVRSLVAAGRSRYGALKMAAVAEDENLKRCSLTTMWPVVASIHGRVREAVCGIECSSVYSVNAAPRGGCRNGVPCPSRALGWRLRSELRTSLRRADRTGEAGKSFAVESTWRVPLEWTWPVSGPRPGVSRQVVHASVRFWSGRQRVDNWARKRSCWPSGPRKADAWPFEARRSRARLRSSRSRSGSVGAARGSWATDDSRFDGRRLRASTIRCQRTRGSCRPGFTRAVCAARSGRRKGRVDENCPRGHFR